MTQDFFKPGDPILFGKFKNRHGILVRVFVDEKGQPMIEIQPVPKGRKKNRIMSLFRIWHDPKPPEQAAAGGEKLALGPSEEDEDE
jgi:hypothetical protein